MTTERTVELEGSYSWALLLDIDNTNGGEYERVHTITVETKLSRKTLKSSIVRTESAKDEEFKNKVSVGGIVKLLNISVDCETTFSNHQSLFNEISSSDDENFEVNRTETIQETITVKAGEKFTLYQLQFTAPGVFSTFSAKASKPLPASRVLIRTIVELIGGPIVAGTYSIQSVAHKNFICCHPGGEGAIVDMQKVPRDWEKITVVPIRDNVVGLRSFHGTYLRGHAGAEGSKVDLQVDKHNWGAMGWEQWIIVPALNGSFGIRSTHGTYLRAHPGESGKLDLQVDKHNWNAMGWEQFRFHSI